MAFLSTNHYISSLQKRRNSSPSRIQNSGFRSKAEQPFEKQHPISDGSHSTLTSFDTVQQKYRRPTKLPPIVTITEKKKEKEGQLGRKKASFLKNSSKVHVQNTQEVVDAEGTSEILPIKSAQRKRQVKADDKSIHAFLEKDEMIYQDEKERNGKSFELAWEPNQDRKEDVDKDEPSLSYFQNAENAGLIGKKGSRCSGQGNLTVSNRLKVKPQQDLKPPSREITNAPASGLQKKSSEFKQMKFPQTASASEYQVKRESNSAYGSTRQNIQGSTVFTMGELYRRRRPLTCDSQLIRNLPILPKIKQNPSVQFPGLLEGNSRGGTQGHLIPRTIHSEREANKNSSSWSEYNSGAVERDSDLERERRRIQKLCRAQNDLIRDSFEEESCPVRCEEGNWFRTSIADVPEHNDSKGTGLPELEPRQPLMLRTVTKTPRLRAMSSVPQKSTSTLTTYLSCRKSSIAQRCSGNLETTLDARGSTVRTHRESIQKLDVYEFLEEEYEPTVSMEQPSNSALSRKDSKKAMRDIFQFLRRL